MRLEAKEEASSEEEKGGLNEKEIKYGRREKRMK